MEGIEIRITGNTPLETLASLAAFGMHCLANSDICDAATRIYNLEAAREAEKKRQDAAAASDEAAAADFAARAKERDQQAAAAPSVPPMAPTPPVAPVTPPAAPTPLPAAPVTPPAAPFVPVPNPGQPAPPITPDTVPGQMAFGMPPAAPASVPTAAPSYTLEDITRAGAEFLAAHPEQQGTLFQLFPQFGIQSLPELRPEQLAHFAAAMRALGVRI